MKIYKDPNFDDNDDPNRDDDEEVPCIDRRGHKWVVSDENENVCYCERCGCIEY